MSTKHGPVSEDELQGWIDGRLPPGRLSEISVWLAEHPEEAARPLAYRAQRDQLRARLMGAADEPVPVRLRADVIQAALQPGRGKPWLTGRQGWHPAGAMAAAVACLAFGAATGWVARGTAPAAAPIAASTAPATLLAADAVQAHLTFVKEVRHPVEVPATQEAHLVAWLSARLGHTLRAPNLQRLGFRLMGGRLLPADAAPAAQLMYEDSQGIRLTLYVRPATQDGTGFEVIERAGMSGFEWFDRGFGFAVLATTDRERLLHVADAVHDQLLTGAQVNKPAAAPL